MNMEQAVYLAEIQKWHDEIVGEARSAVAKAAEVPESGRSKSLRRYYASR
jgi:hypothetical protein